MYEGIAPRFLISFCSLLRRRKQQLQADTESRPYSTKPRRQAVHPFCNPRSGAVVLSRTHYISESPPHSRALLTI